MMKIFEKFKDEYGYIIDTDKVVSYLEERSKTKEEIIDYLILINEYNLKIYKIIDEDNKIQKRMSKLNPSVSLIEETEIAIKYVKEQTRKENEDSKNKVDISYYVVLINELLENEFLKEEVLEVLPSKEDPDFDNIINTILLHYQKELLELATLNDNNDIEFIQYIENEQNKINSISDILINYRDALIEEKPKDKKMNILLDPSLYESDIDMISTEHYRDFYVLLSDLQKNILRGVKTFTPIGRNKAVTEVRYNGARILFDKIDNQTYYAYYIFHKKDTDKYYHEKLVKRANNYSNNKNKLLEEFYNPQKKQEFLDINKSYYDNVISILYDKKTKEGGDSGKVKKRVK